MKKLMKIFSDFFTKNKAKEEGRNVYVVYHPSTPLDVRYFINKFERVPEDFIIDNRSFYRFDNMQVTLMEFLPGDELAALSKIIEEAFGSEYSLGYIASAPNPSRASDQYTFVDAFPQEYARDRILSALYLIEVANAHIKTVG